MQSAQSTSTHLSYSPAPEGHILTEGRCMSSEQALQVPGPALPATLAAIYHAFCGCLLWDQNNAKLWGQQPHFREGEAGFES